MYLVCRLLPPPPCASPLSLHYALPIFRGGGLANGKPAVLIIVFRQPGANIIDTVDRVRDLLPQLRASISQAVNLDVINDRTTTIRASVKDRKSTRLNSSHRCISYAVFCPPPPVPHPFPYTTLFRSFAAADSRTANQRF